MTVNYQVVGGSGWTLLFNEAAGDANERFAPTFRDQLQSVSGYGAANTVKVPQSNTQGQLALRWSSNYASADAALAAIKTLRSTFKGVAVNLQVIQGATTQYFNNAVLSSSAHDLHGKECMHSMTFETDDIS